MIRSNPDLRQLHGCFAAGSQSSMQRIEQVEVMRYAYYSRKPRIGDQGGEMLTNSAAIESSPRIRSILVQGWFTLLFLLVATVFVGCGSAPSSSEYAAATEGADEHDADGFLVVDCLLPGQVHKLGKNFNYLTQRRPIKTSASDCEIRGGEYVAYDRANYSTALKIWLPRAKEGDARAQNYVGEIYERGLGLAPDYQLAAHWYTKAADQGDSRAQINLGHLHELGLGVPADRMQALHYYRMASGVQDDRLLFASTLSTNYVTRSEYDSVRSELQAQTIRAQELHGRLEGISSTLKIQSAALKQAQKQLANTERELEQIVAQRRTESAPGAAQKMENVKLVSQIQQLEEQRQLLEQEVAQLSSQNRQLEQRQASLDEQIADTARNRLDGQQQLKEAQQQLAGSRQEIVNSEQELKEMRDRLAREQAKTASVTPQIALLQKELDAKLKALDEQRHNFTALEQENLSEQRRLRESVAGLADKAEQLQARNAELAQQKANMQALLTESDSQSQELQRQLLLSRAALEMERVKFDQERSKQDQQHQKAMAERQRALVALSEQLQNQARIEELEVEAKRYVDELERAKMAAAKQTQIAAVSAPPRIEIIEPPVVLTRSIPTVRLLTEQDAREVIGKVSAPAGLLSLNINGEIVTPKSNNLFRSVVPIAGEVTPVDIVVVDNEGRRAALNFSFVIDPSARDQAGAGLFQIPDTEAAPERGLGKIDWPMGEYHALIIGNNDYQHFSTLVTAVNDARETEELLRTKYNFRTTLLLNADRYQILSTLNDLMKELTEKDNLLIYYARHGKLDETSGKGYWLPVDAELKNSANWISNTAITDILGAIPAKHILVVADSCYSGTLGSTPLPRLSNDIAFDKRRKWVEAMADTRARITLTSGGLEPVLDGGGGDHSIFAKAFIQTLRENKELIEGYSLYARILDRMTANPMQLAQAESPQYAAIQHAGHESGEFFFNPN